MTAAEARFIVDLCHFSQHRSITMSSSILESISKLGTYAMDAPLLNEKDSHASEAQDARRLNRRPNRFIGHFLPAILLTSAVLLLFRATFLCHGHYNAAKFEDEVDGRVALEAHIMSKCPDARDCLQQLVVPTMEKVSDKVDFTLSYIGRFAIRIGSWTKTDTHSFDEKSDSLSCMHGPSECLGNMIQLCAARIYPDPRIYLGFANCMTTNYSQIPDRDFVASCAMEHGVDFNRINKCISEEGHGSELLRNSFIRSHENNVTKSCTVRLAGKVRCIRDGGKWYDCPGGSEVSDLVDDIEKLYKESMLAKS